MRARQRQRQELLRTRAGYTCEYCRIPEALMGDALSLEPKRGADSWTYGNGTRHRGGLTYERPRPCSDTPLLGQIRCASVWYDINTVSQNTAMRCSLRLGLSCVELMRG
jgi:hypothetical protein